MSSKRSIVAIVVEAIALAVVIGTIGVYANENQEATLAVPVSETVSTVKETTIPVEPTIAADTTTTSVVGTTTSKVEETTTSTETMTQEETTTPTETVTSVTTTTELVTTTEVTTTEVTTTEVTTKYSGPWYEGERDGFLIALDQDGNELDEIPTYPPSTKETDDEKEQIEENNKEENTTYNNGEPAYGSDAYLIAYAMSREAAAGNDVDAYYVGNVILNRVEDPDFPNSVYEVLKQKNQYPWSDDTQFSREKIYDDRFFTMAQELLNGYRPLPKYVVYQAQFVQGSGVYVKVGVHYYCAK